MHSKANAGRYLTNSIVVCILVLVTIDFDMTFLGWICLILVVLGLLSLLWEGFKCAIHIDHFSDLWRNKGERNS